MKKLVYLGALTAITFAAATTTTMAQQGLNITVDEGSINLFGKNYTNIKGSAFLYDKWSKGSVKLSNGVVYEGMNLLYDQVKDELIFVTDEGKQQAFVYPVFEFTLLEAINDAVVNERVFRNNFPVTDGTTPSAYYEVLNDGETKLLKRASKAIVEERPDGSIVKEKLIKESTKYYISTSDKMIKISKSKRSVLDALTDKATQMESYIKQNNLNVKEDADLVRLVAYYNTL